MEVESILENLVSIKDFDFSRLWDLEYLLEGAPGKDFDYRIHAYILAGLLLVGAILLIAVVSKRLDLKPKADFVKRIGTYLIISFIWGFLFISIRGVGIRVLSARITLVVWLLSIVGIVIYALVYKAFFLQKRIDHYWASKTREKYIPKKKKKQ